VKTLQLHGIRLALSAFLNTENCCAVSSTAWSAMWLRGVPNARMGFSSWILQTKAKNAFTTGGMAIVLYRDYAWWTPLIYVSLKAEIGCEQRQLWIHPNTCVNMM